MTKLARFGAVVVLVGSLVAAMASPAHASNWCTTAKPGSHPDWQMLQYNDVNNTIPVTVDSSYTLLIGGGPIYGYRVIWAPVAAVHGGVNLGANSELLIPDSQINVPWVC